MIWWMRSDLAGWVSAPSSAVSMANVANVLLWRDNMEEEIWEDCLLTVSGDECVNNYSYKCVGELWRNAGWTLLQRNEGIHYLQLVVGWVSEAISPI